MNNTSLDGDPKIPESIQVISPPPPPLPPPPPPGFFAIFQDAADPVVISVRMLAGILRDSSVNDS